MDTTNYNPIASTLLEDSASSNGKRQMNAGAAALAGGVIGSVIPHVIGKIKDTLINEESESADDTKSGANTAASWADEKISTATCVNDDMSFNEAFASARNEVGAGGAFEWHGKVYGTYYAEEWNAMTPEAKAEYNNHFSWNHFDTSATNQHASSSDDIEIVSIDQPGQTYPSTTATEVEVMAAEPEIEILGVVHDMSTGSNIGGLSVGGQEVFLIDVDGDMEFDIMASDLNNNNVVDDGEVVDIQGQGLTVNDLGGVSQISENLGGEDELPDYMTDNSYEI